MWKTIVESKREQYVRFLREQDAEIGSFLETGSPRQWDIPRSDDDGIGSSGTATDALRVPVGVKDNIAVAGYHLTCGSRMLEEVVSPYTATAIERLSAAGAAVVGKTNLDEFGMGSSTDNSALGRTHNPWDDTRVAGGSSGGSAAAVARQLVPLAVGSDTGGSVRQPAAFCGVYGLKPTYGTISRYGLVAYASSLEVIGLLGADVDLLAAAYSAMSGRDPRDHTSVDVPEATRTGGKAGVKTGGKAAVAVLEGDLGLDPAVERNYRATVEALKELGHPVSPVKLSTLEYVVPAYYTIAAAEAAANLARYNGVRYGYRPVYSENPEELMRAARTEAFGDEVKLRIILGTYVLRSGFQDQYYTRAQKIRTLIRRELDETFREFDLMVLPAFPTQAFAHGDDGMDPFQQKVADRFTGTANLAAIPALTVPTGLEGGLPVGMQLMGPAFSEERLFSVARELSGVMPLEFPADSKSFTMWEEGVSD
jgi:aspartyl-tRNA(Asn)/glutamyl-tRNA(Gln) amidotransferase subunit A